MSGTHQQQQTCGADTLAGYERDINGLIDTFALIVSVMDSCESLGGISCPHIACTTPPAAPPRATDA
jgi:hypothetical protein